MHQSHRTENCVGVTFLFGFYIFIQIKASAREPKRKKRWACVCVCVCVCVWRYESLIIFLLLTLHKTECVLSLSCGKNHVHRSWSTFYRGKNSVNISDIWSYFCQLYLLSSRDYKYIRMNSCIKYISKCSIHITLFFFMYISAPYCIAIFVEKKNRVCQTYRFFIFCHTYL